MRKTIDLLLLLAWIAAVVCLAVSLLHSSDLKAQREVTEKEARRLYTAFSVFYESNGEYPGAYAGLRFDRESLDPLRRGGFYDGDLPKGLLQQRVDGYDSPDDRGLNQEFWLEMTLADDPSTRYVVARSDNAPLSGGKWLDGVYVSRNGRLEALR
jgi:hypothetical protein